MPHDIIANRESYLADAGHAPSASRELLTAAHGEAALTEEIAKVELEIGERVSALYGL